MTDPCKREHCPIYEECNPDEQGYVRQIVADLAACEEVRP